MSLPLASLADVKRILRLTDADADRDAQIQAALDAVSSWAEKRLVHIGKEGNWVEAYFDVPEDATLHLPTDDLTVTVVRAYEYPSSAGVPLSPVSLGLGHGYDLTDDGKLILRPTLFVSPFEGAAAQRRLRVYARVEVHYVGTGVIPRAVTEGVAFLAAGYWMDTPRALRGLQSEKIGDYSYTLGKPSSLEEAPSYVAQGMWFLVPYLRKNRVAVI